MNCLKQHAATQIQSLRHQIRKQDKKQEVRMQEVRALIQDTLKEQIVRDMQYVSDVFSTRTCKGCLCVCASRSFLDEKIKEEIALQTRQQVEAQLRDHVPVPLEEQIVGSRNQIIEVRHALMNS